jgi:hypothetical protein
MSVFGTVFDNQQELQRYIGIMRLKTICLSAVGTALLVVISGCLEQQYVVHGSQTYFDFPNSNVTPLGPVKVEVPGPSSFLAPPDMISSESDNIVYTAALAQQPGANLIIDYTKMYKSYMFWPVQWTKLQLEGTACKMEVGKQEMK